MSFSIGATCKPQGVIFLIFKFNISKYSLVLVCCTFDFVSLLIRLSRPFDKKSGILGHSESFLALYF